MLHVISRKALKDFWEKHPQSRSSLEKWYSVVRHANWQTFSDVRATFNSADQVGRCFVFNVGGNRYRVIAAIHFNRSKVFLRAVLTHAEYDGGAWKHGCQ